MELQLLSLTKEFASHSTTPPSYSVSLSLQHRGRLCWAACASSGTFSGWGPNGQRRKTEPLPCLIDSSVYGWEAFVFLKSKRCIKIASIMDWYDMSHEGFWYIYILCSRVRVVPWALKFWSFDSLTISSSKLLLVLLHGFLIQAGEVFASEHPWNREELFWCRWKMAQTWTPWCIACGKWNVQR